MAKVTTTNPASSPASYSPDATPPAPLELPGVPAPRIGHRDLFPQLAARAYLAHAAISPASLAVTAAVEACTTAVARYGVATFLGFDEQRDRLRGGLGRLLNVSAEHIALTGGTTRGITDLALSLPLTSRDELVTFDGEFPANVTPWQIAARQAGSRLTLLPQPTAETLDHTIGQVHARLRAGARWVAVSAVQFQTGLRMPLKELASLCRESGAHLLVDAIQATGVVPVDASTPGVSALVGGAHKWLLGLEGAGYAYIAPELQKELSPSTAGWLSHEDGALFLFQGAGHLRYDRPLKTNALVFEGSTASITGFVALEAGVDVVLALGASAIFQHVQTYHDAVEPVFVRRGFRSLRAVSPEARSGNLSFELPEGLQIGQLAGNLRKRGVVVSTPDGRLRLAPHFSNSIEEVAIVELALDESLAV